jgi:hypothetical protein
MQAEKTSDVTDDEVDDLKVEPGRSRRLRLPGGIGAGPAAPRPALPGWRRLAGEGAILALLYSAFTVACLKALRTPGQTFYGDVLIGWFGPEKHGSAAWLRDGVFPAWTRSQFGGEPYVANIQHALLYPGNIPFWTMPTSTALKVVAAGHIALAAILMWAYCRIALRTGMWGAVVAGLGFGFGAQTLLHIVLINQLQVIAWMPLVLLGGHLVLERRELRWMVLTAVAIGLQFLSGHPEEWVYTLIALALQGVFWAVFANLGSLRERVRAVVFGGARLAGAVGGFVLLFGWQLFPTLQLQEQGWRTTPGFNEQYPLPIGITVNSLLPDYANVLKGEFAGFVGVVVLGLAALGIAAGRRDLRWTRIWLGFLGVLGLLMAVGLRSPLYKAAYESVAIIAQFRVPTRWLLMGSFGFSAAAALGTDVLLAKDVAWARRARQGLGAVALLGVLFLVAMSVGNATIDKASLPWWLLAGGIGVVAWVLAGFPKVPRIALALLLVITTGTELNRARLLAEQQVVAPDSVYDDPGPVMARLAAQGGRYVTITGEPQTQAEAMMIPTPQGLTPIEGAYYRAGHNRSLSARPGWSYAVHAENIVGRDGGLMPLRAYTEFFAATAGAPGKVSAGIFEQPPSKWNFATLDFLGTRWFVSPGLPPEEAKVLEDNGFTILQRAGYVLVWGRPEPPIARMQYDLDVIPDPAQRLQRLKAGYPLATRAMVDEPIAGITGGADPGASTKVTNLGQSSVTVEATTSKQGLLVVADPWYPGWSVTVDGRSADLLKVDHAFRGVVLSPGRHTVKFTYTDRPLQVGILLAGLTIIALAGWTFWTRRRRRRAQPEVEPEAAAAA